MALIRYEKHLKVLDRKLDKLMCSLAPVLRLRGALDYHLDEKRLPHYPDVGREIGRMCRALGECAQETFEIERELHRLAKKIGVKVPLIIEDEDL